MKVTDAIRQALHHLDALLITYRYGQRDRAFNPSFDPDTRQFIQDEYQEAWRMGWNSRG